MDKILEAILQELAEIKTGQAAIQESVDEYIADLKEFSERFEEVVTSLENERRLDRLADFD